MGPSKCPRHATLIYLFIIFHDQIPSMETRRFRYIANTNLMYIRHSVTQKIKIKIDNFLKVKVNHYIDKNLNSVIT